MMGALVVLPVAASTGAARTETASSAAEMVFNIVGSSFERDHGVAGRMAGLVDHAATLGGARLTQPEARRRTSFICVTSSSCSNCARPRNWRKNSQKIEKNVTGMFRYSGCSKERASV